MRCDAFAAKPCTGNSAAVLFSHRGGDATWMQKARPVHTSTDDASMAGERLRVGGQVAAENNLSETAFVEFLESKSEPSEDLLSENREAAPSGNVFECMRARPVTTYCTKRVCVVCVCATKTAFPQGAG